MTTKTKTKTEYARALDSVSRYLALRDHSRMELVRKLERRYSAEVIEAVLATCDEHRLLAPPEEMAERASESLQRRGKSHRYIQGQLTRRGLPVPPVNDEKELANACRLVEKKFGPARELDFATRGRAYRFLKYRGFADRTIRMVFNDRQE